MISLALKEYKTIHYLMPGELYIAKNPSAVWTVLGSCISVVFHHKKSGIGAICHAQLPQPHNQSNCFDNCPENCRMDSGENNQFKYVTCAVKYMVNEFKKLHIPLRDLEIKMFGGADINPGGGSRPSIGKQNIESALKTLKEEGLSVAFNDTGGTTGRNILFLSRTGEVIAETHLQKKAELMKKK